MTLHFLNTCGQKKKKKKKNTKVLQQWKISKTAPVLKKNQSNVPFV